MVSGSNNSQTLSKQEQRIKIHQLSVITESSCCLIHAVAIHLSLQLTRGVQCKLSKKELEGALAKVQLEAEVAINEVAAEWRKTGCNLQAGNVGPCHDCKGSKERHMGDEYRS